MSIRPLRYIRETDDQSVRYGYSVYRSNDRHWVFLKEDGMWIILYQGGIAESGRIFKEGLTSGPAFGGAAFTRRRDAVAAIEAVVGDMS